MNMDAYPNAAARPRVTGQVIMGLLVIVVGVIFTLDNLEIIDARDYVQYWPAALVLVGVVKLWQAARIGRGWFSGLFFTGIGSWMLIERVAYITLDARVVWPLLLVALGCFMVSRGFGLRSRPISGDASAHVSGLAILGGIERRSNTTAFSGGDLTAVLGGCDINLRDASMAPGTEAVLDVFAFWGGIDLKVPEDWAVVNRVIPVLGGVEDKTRTVQPASGKRLVIRGMVVMGGITVKN
jgi:Domain of unknown function (DUF5668)